MLVTISPFIARNTVELKAIYDYTEFEEVRDKLSTKEGYFYELDEHSFVVFFSQNIFKNLGMEIQCVQYVFDTLSEQVVMVYKNPTMREDNSKRCKTLFKLNPNLVLLSNAFLVVDNQERIDQLKIKYNDSFVLDKYFILTETMFKDLLKEVLV